MDKSQVLKEISCLITAGFRTSAIDLIQQYLEYTPNDPFLLSSLGRIYLLDNKPELAVKYLELSHKISHNEITKSETNKHYEFDNLNADDLAYIDETEYTVEDIGASINSDIPDIQPYQPSSIFIQKNITRIESDFSQKASLISDHKSYADHDFESSTVQPKTNTFAKNWQSDPLYGDEEVDLDEYEHDESDPDPEDNIFIIPEKDDDLIEKEFDWNDLDEFDEIDEQEAFDPLCDYGGKLDKQIRAKQIAVEVIQAYDWGKENWRYVKYSG